MSKRQRVISSWSAVHTSLFNRWRDRRVWELRLECGHTVWRYRSRFPKPPKSVVCNRCGVVRSGGEARGE